MAYKLSIVEGVEGKTVCTPLSVNNFITIAIQHLEYHCKALLPLEVALNRNYPS
jgi:hypothetical protein